MSYQSMLQVGKPCTSNTTGASGSPRSAWKTRSCSVWPMASVGLQSNQPPDSSQARARLPSSVLVRQAFGSTAVSPHAVGASTNVATAGRVGPGFDRPLAHDVELHAVDQGVVVDRPGVGRPSTERLEVGLSRPLEVLAVMDEKGSSSISSTSIITDPLP